MKLSVVMPARNEQDCIAGTLTQFAGALKDAGVPFEIVVVDDGSTDRTGECVLEVARAHPEVRLVTNTDRHGFGLAVRKGLESITGDAVSVVMADASDSPSDLIAYYGKLLDGYDCVFGSRFIPGSRVVDYPSHKLVINRFANWFIKVLFGLRYNDVTNAFKCYRRDVVQGMTPLISPHFNLTVEMPLKAIIRGYSFAIIPITWTNRQTGVSKLKLKEMGSRYLFIVLYLWLEKHLARGDYHRRHEAPAKEGARPTHA
jgi:dolichol-phosphate mannosyltransferase